MAQPNDIEVRVAALETQVRDLAARVRTSQQDAAAARVLAGGADRDVTEFRGAIRELRGEIREFRDQNTRVLNVMREDVTDLRTDMTDLRTDMTDLRTEMTELRTQVDTGFIEMRGKLDATATGLQQIVTLLDTVLDQRGGHSSDE